jgi:hypothetical protein
MNAAKRNLIRKGLIIAAIIALAGGAYALYLFNMPHRDVVGTKADLTLAADALVNEFLADAAAANGKYLDAEGESKVLAVSGTVAGIDTDLNGNTVVLLKAAGADAGVRCSFTTETNSQTAALKTGDATTIKGVIRAGAAYDEDLELYEHAILEKCSISNP